MFGKNKNDKKIKDDELGDVKIHTMQDDLGGYIDGDENESESYGDTPVANDFKMKESSPFATALQSDQGQPELEEIKIEEEIKEEAPVVEPKKMDGFSASPKTGLDIYSQPTKKEDLSTPKKDFSFDDNFQEKETDSYIENIPENAAVDAIPVMPKSVDNITTAVENKDEFQGFNIPRSGEYQGGAVPNTFGNDISEDEIRLESGGGSKALIFVIIALIIVLALGVGGYFFWISDYSTEMKKIIVGEKEDDTSQSHIFTEEPNIVIEGVDNNGENPTDNGTNVGFSDEVNFLKINSAEINESALKNLFMQTFLDIDSYSGNLLEFVLVDENNNPIKLSQFSEAFGLNFSSNIKAYLGEEFSLYFYKSGSIKKMGISMKVSDKDLIKVNLKNSEAGLADSIKSIYMGEVVSTQNSIFNSSNYSGVDVRFFNSDENNSMDYAIVGEYLMIATSKDSGRAIIDKILMEEVRSTPAVEGAETVSVNTEKTKNIFDESLINDKDSKEGETIIKTE